jgi:hypothetical protein
MLFRDYFYALRTIPPFFPTISGAAPIVTFPHPTAVLADPGAIFNDGAQYDKNRQTYMMQWNLSVQREVLPSTLVGISYVGTRGLFLNRQGDMNTAVPTIQQDGRFFYPLGSVRRDSHFQSTSTRTLTATSSYHGLQMKIAHRISQGLQAQVAYTWSHSLDNSVGAISGDYQQTSSPQNPWDINKSEWGHSAFDLRHVLTANYTYTLPFGKGLSGVAGKLLGGWQTNGIMSLTSGVPFSLSNSAGLNIDRSATAGSNISRPDVISGMSNNPTRGSTAGCTGVTAGRKLATPDLWFDPCAFKLQDAGYYGTLGRDTLIGPKLRNFDFALVKNTAIGENKSLQFRWEVFNLLNHPNFALPTSAIFTAASGIPSTSAGQITSTITDPREMQFGLKITF